MRGPSSFLGGNQVGEFLTQGPRQKGIQAGVGVVVQLSLERLVQSPKLFWGVQGRRKGANGLEGLGHRRGACPVIPSPPCASPTL